MPLDIQLKSRAVRNTEGNEWIYRFNILQDEKKKNNLKFNYTADKLPEFNLAFDRMKTNVKVDEIMG